MQLDSELLKQIQSLCKKYPEIKKLFLFGSFARGDASRTSDIDLCVDGFATSERFNEFKEATMNSIATLKKIDVLNFHNLPKHLLQSITEEGKIIYESKS
jgi:predicted nucleotidyltransferase